MKYNTALALLTIVTASQIVFAQEDADATKKVLAQLQGDWRIVEGQFDGQKLEIDPTSELSVRHVQGNKYLRADGKELGTIHIDPTSSPMVIDFTVAGEDVREGIFEVTGDTWRWCYFQPGLKERPVRFPTEAKHGMRIYVLHRIKN